MEQDEFPAGGLGGGDGAVGIPGSVLTSAGVTPPAPPVAASSGVSSSGESGQGASSGNEGAGAAEVVGAERNKEKSASQQDDGVLDFDDPEFDALDVAGAATQGRTGTAAAEGMGGAAPTGGAAATSKAAGETLGDELSQLEELERELGIMGVVGDSAGGGRGGGGGNKAAPEGGAEVGKSDDGFDMDNLDELEGYLESLAK